MKMKKFHVIFDNGGGTTLQVGKRGFVHFYDTGDKCAVDVKALLDGDDTQYWDGNEPEYRESYNYETERNNGYRWHDQDDVTRIVGSGVLKYEENFGYNMRDFYQALGVEIEE